MHAETRKRPLHRCEGVNEGGSKDEGVSEFYTVCLLHFYHVRSFVPFATAATTMTMMERIRVSHLLSRRENQKLIFQFLEIILLHE